MPRRPPHPCAHPGCPKLTDSRYCEEHSKAEARRYNRYDRDPTSKKRYGRPWQKVRARFLAAHPLCAECLANGRTTPASEVHHILPLSRGGTHAEDNLMALCKPCHSAISARDGDRWGSR
ncbi:MAG: HNH endonuclease signature motif containing protein [Christensenellaceae bacterium]|nr:HNH endonuclease signature motif containing protein [Christensenellaceae bacterium]MEA5067310.1 HNH endonuclease signature motif containing protein [Eubacteriales bacterium]MEA5067957.1 HNH endonuclease signature motif containing protein [Christensenellaceae bacterium]